MGRSGSACFAVEEGEHQSESIVQNWDLAMKKQIKRMLAPLVGRLGFVPWSPPPQEKTYLEKCFSLLNRLGFRPKHIVDVGANCGGWTRTALRYFPDAHFTLLEPQDWLKQNVQDLLDANPKIYWHNVGAGDKEGVCKFTLNKRNDSSTFNCTAEEALKLGFQQVDVPVVTINRLLRDSGLPVPDIIKIDAEGLDLSVFKGCDSYYGKTEVFFMEASIMNKSFSNELLSVMQTMNRYGYRMFDFTDLNRTQKHGALWLVEAVFVKTSGQLDCAVVSYD
jgi:FkbM family methyltransferase